MHYQDALQIKISQLKIQRKMHIHFILHFSSAGVSYAAISTVSEDCHLLTSTAHLHDWIYSLVCPTPVYHSASNWINLHLDVAQPGSCNHSMALQLWKRNIYLWQTKLVQSSVFLQTYSIQKFVTSSTLQKENFLSPSVHWSVDCFLSNFKTKWFMLWQHRAHVY